MCSLCLTTRTGDGTARRRAQEDRYEDPVPFEEQISRTTAKLAAFLDRLQQ